MFKTLLKSCCPKLDCLDHAVNAIKHFILKFDTDSINDYLTTSLKGIETIKENLTDHINNNYVTKLDSIEDKFVNVKENLTKPTEFGEKILKENAKLDEIESYIHNKLESIEAIDDGER